MRVAIRLAAAAVCTPALRRVSTVVAGSLISASICAAMEGGKVSDEDAEDEVPSEVDRLASVPPQAASRTSSAAKGLFMVKPRA